MLLHTPLVKISVERVEITAIQQLGNTLKFNERDLLSRQQYRSLETCLFDRANPRRVKVVIFLSMSNANAAP